MNDYKIVTYDVKLNIFFDWKINESEICFLLTFDNDVRYIRDPNWEFQAE